jgi:cytochrome c peroxidase
MKLHPSQLFQARPGGLLPSAVTPFHAVPIVVLLFAPAGLAGQTPASVRALIEARTGGLEKLQVPATDADLPQPRLESGEIDPRFQITEAKRYLGKLLFQDPIRTNNIRPEMGGDLSTMQTASCGSCHFGEAGTKAGQVINLAVGGQGRMVMDARGNFVISRTMVPGMVDLVPTPIEKRDAEGNLLLDGKFDQVDSVPRLSPSMVGFAFNNRLLLGGNAGEPFDPSNPAKANKNPDGLPAGENLVQIAISVHRMAETQQIALQGNPVYRKLFVAAFPEEHARYLTSGNLDDYINDDTTIRAIAAFLRTVITRNTPWDRFLAGDDTALSPRQLRGAELFVKSAAEGGAGCIDCHSGPALNKQLGDEAGLLVEENFYNLGVKEHPLQDLVRSALEDPDHHDVGRQEATADPADAFKFRTLTLRQLKDGGQFLHSGEFSSVREVIEYFNRGEPSYPLAAAAGNVTPRFTNPRGPGLIGLGLSEADIDALEDFLVSGLYDPGLVVDDPASPTRTFDANLRDLTYQDELKALGAVDGLLPSLMAVGNNDALSREQTIFVRGRANGDEVVDLSDGIYLLNYLFFRGPEPVPMVAGDTNHDGRLDIGDPIYLIAYLYYGGPPPAMPFPYPAQLTR